MKDLPSFVKIGEDRINIEEIIGYGLAVDEDEDRYPYIGTRGDDISEYYADSVDFDLDEKIAELDDLFLIKRADGYKMV